MESLEQQEVFGGVQLGAEEPQFSSRKDRSDTQLGDEGRIISLPEAARMLCTSYPTVHRLVNAGELKAFRIRNSWRTSTAACEEFVRRRFEEQAKICQSVEVD